MDKIDQKHNYSTIWVSKVHRAELTLNYEIFAFKSNLMYCELCMVNYQLYLGELHYFWTTL